MSSKFTGCWLTTNRSCNIRCSWCYAFETGFSNKDEMTLETAYKIIDICVDADIRKIILIGGEPTLYSNIFEIIKECKKNNIQTTLVTNGIVLSDKVILKKYLDAGISSFSISLKAPNKNDYLSLTGKDCFDKVIQAIKNLSEAKANFAVTTVITNLNVDSFLEGLKIAKENGCKNFGLSFCYNFDFNDNSRVEFIKNNNPYVISKRFYSHYDDLCKELEGCNWSLEQALPLCVWDDEPIKRMDENNHLRSICQLLRGNGLLFDTDGSLIPCNAMYKIKYGKLGCDFVDYESLLKYLETDEVKQLFRKLRGAPDKKCLECEKATNCGGGCVTNWTNYTFDELMKMRG